MLLHSREGSGDHRPVDVNALVRKVSISRITARGRRSRASTSRWSGRSTRQRAKSISYPQEVSRFFLNIIANVFTPRTSASRRPAVPTEPMLVASTKNLGDRVEIRIRDNGTGIRPR